LPVFETSKSYFKFGFGLWVSYERDFWQEKKLKRKGKRLCTESEWKFPEGKGVKN